MKFDREAWIQKKRKVPRGTYLLMMFMGIYLFYIMAKAIGGLNEMEASARILIYIGVFLLAVAAFSFIMTGMSALVKRDYREAYPEEEENAEPEEEPADEPAEINPEPDMPKDKGTK